MVIVAATIAKVLGRDEARKLADFRNALPIPAEVHDKEAHWVSLAQLEAVAEALLQEGRAPDPSEKRTVHPGFRAASRFQRGMILKFMIRIPVRQRNIREMQLGKNLYQDREGHWHVRFRGAELKVGMRGASVNVYHVDLTDYCPDLIPVLEEFLTIRRPKLPNAAESDYVFVTRFGNPFTAGHLREELHTAVAMRTGRRFYPHLIRTVWATEYLTHPKTYGNYQGAAYMLGDTVQMVIKVYAHVVEKEQLAKAADFLGAVLGKKSA